jgi:mannose-1-phosphate guanylyltransferase/mannose-6-phosphate isomerase
MTYVIILAGGIGSRFWPLSRRDYPKQFLKLDGNAALAEQALRRARWLAPKENIYFAAAAGHKALAVNLLRGKGIPQGNALFEPQGKNTFAPVALLCRKIYARDKGALVIAVPADNLIKGDSAFLQALESGLRAAGRGFIATVGIRPTRPDTGYGYIKIQNLKNRERINGYYGVDKFIEKPALAKARKIYRNKDYYWNAGIFIFKAEVFLEEAARYMAQADKIISRIADGGKIKALWQRLPAISIDYAIMEKTRRLVLIPAKFRWSDFGSWEALCSELAKDKNGNCLRGRAVLLQSKDSLAWAGRRLVCGIGLRDMLVVETGDAVLVCHRRRAQDVKLLVEELKRRGLKRLL